MNVEVEVWADVVCPWCYLGHRRLERALAGFEHADDVRVVHRSFELDPSAPRERTGDPVAHLAAKYGLPREQAQAMDDRLTGLAAAEGLTVHLERRRGGNTFDAHRLLHWAAGQERAAELSERLYRAYFADGEPIGDPATLARLSDEVGLDPAAAAAVLAGEVYADAVRVDQDEARRLGVTGVPFFLLDRRYAVAGAQEAEVLLAALRRAWDDTRAAGHDLAVG